MSNAPLMISSRPLTRSYGKCFACPARHLAKNSGFPLVLGILLLLLQACRSNNNLYPVQIDSFYGYINHRGALLIAPQYANARNYAEGFAPVQRSDGSLAYLNLKGEELEVPGGYGKVEKIDIFSEGLARVVVDRKIGYINKQFQWAIAPQYRQAGRFSGTLASVLDADRQQASYIDRNGAEVFSLANVSAIGPMRAGYAYFVRDERFGIIDEQGRVQQEPDFLFLASADPASGLARALDDKTELYGYVDRNGSWIISPRYPDAGDFSNGFAAVFIRSKNRYGYIDTRGALRIPGRYLEAGDFHDGFAWVRLARGSRYIDKDGSWLSPLIFSRTHDFHEGLAAALQGSEFLYISSRGTITWPGQEAK